MNVRSRGYRRFIYLVPALLIQLGSSIVASATSPPEASPAEGGQTVSLATLPFSAPL